MIIWTNAHDGCEGPGFSFTCGNGNQFCAAAIESMAPLLVGISLEEVTADMARAWRRVGGHSQLPWLWPEKGVIYLATVAVYNAVWDMSAEVEGKPFMEASRRHASEDIVRCIDFRGM